MEEQILINYTKNENEKFILINTSNIRKTERDEEVNMEFIGKLKNLIEEYYG